MRLMVACLWALFLCLAAVVQAAPGASPRVVIGASPAKGYFLVASDKMLNPDFYRSVILLVSVEESGVVGVIVNRPTDLRVEQVMPGVEPSEGPGGMVFAGGPVEPSRLMALFRSSEAVPDIEPVFADVYFLADWRIFTLGRQLAANVEHFRLFAGYAGWAPGQLEQELAQGAWFMVPADSAQLFLDRPDELWEQFSPGAGGQWVRLGGFKAAQR